MRPENGVYSPPMSFTAPQPIGSLWPRSDLRAVIIMGVFTVGVSMLFSLTPLGGGNSPSLLFISHLVFSPKAGGIVHWATGSHLSYSD